MAVARSAWTLFLGVGLAFVGHGLQGTLLSFRATGEGFAPWVVGAVMSSYYVGILGGAIVVPRLLASVGHIRVFSAAATTASVIVALYPLVVVPIVWGAGRLVYGLCLSAVFVTAESWLNGRATNETRGRLLSVYVVVSNLGLAGGQLLFGLGPSKGPDLFIVGAALLSISLVPLALDASPAPDLPTHDPLSIRELWRIVPLGVVGILAAGLGQGALFGLGAVFAADLGVSRATVSLVLAMTVAGGVMSQFPLGHWSDRVDRRRAIALVGFFAAAMATGLAFTPELANSPLLLPGFFLFGAASLPVYGLVAAQINDHLPSERSAAGSSVSVRLFGLGAVAGPLAASALLDQFGPDGYLGYLAVVHVIVGVYAVVRMLRSRQSVESQSHFEPLPPHAATLSTEPVRLT